MGQPQQLATLGPFKSIDATSSGPYVAPNVGVAGNNANPHRFPLALCASEGRVNLTTIVNAQAVLAIAPYVNSSKDQQIYGNLQNLQSTPNRFLYDPANNAQTAMVYNGGPDTSVFDQAVQVGSILYDNAGRQYSSAAPANTFNWQYDPFTVSPGSIGGLTVAFGTTVISQPGPFYGVTLNFSFTKLTFGPPGAFAQESSAPTRQVGSGPAQYPAYISITFPTTGTLFYPVISGPATGTNPDGTTFFTNVYMSSSQNPNFYFVVSLTGQGLFNTPYPVIMGGPNQFAGNAQLIPTRDAPPTTSIPGAALAYHKSRVWAFTVKSSTTYPTQNTNSSPQGVTQQQMQLWWSKFGIPWEFDQTGQVALIDSIVAVDTKSAPQKYGEQPVALASLSSVLLGWTTAQTIVVYGDGTTNSPFIIRRIFNLGCRARRSVAVSTVDAVGTVAFWLSDNGVQMTDGNYTMRVDEPIRGIIDNLSLSDRQNAVGFYADKAYYISFPQLNQTWGFYTPTQDWFGPILFSTPFAYFVPYNPEVANGTASLNEVTAIRGTSIDQWFAGGDLDLGQPQFVQWQGAVTTCGDPRRKKAASLLSISAPPQPGLQAGITLTTESEVVQKFVDLTNGSQVTTLSNQAGTNALLFYTLAVEVQFHTSATLTQPATVWAVSVDGEFLDMGAYDDGAWA